MQSGSLPPSRVSLRLVAEKLGISHSTVSLALRDHPRISSAMRERVKATATAMGYRPDPMLAALASYRKGRLEAPVEAAVAWLNCWEDPDKLRSYREFDGYWRGAEKAAKRFGYYLEEFRSCGEQMTSSRVETILSTRHIAGILIPPHPEPPPWQDFHWDEFSVVRFGRSSPSPATHLVTSDHIENTVLALKKMRERGYERIGFVTGDASKRGIQFCPGFEMTQAEIPPRSRVPLLTLDEADLPLSKRKLKDWLTKNKPDAILTDLGNLRQTLHEIGKHVPEDIGLAVESILDGGAEAGIDQRPEEVGRVAMQLLISLINDNERGLPTAARQVLVGGGWVDGASLPRRK